MNGGFRAFLLVAVSGCAGLVLVLGLQFQRAVAHPMFGATFSPDYARYLGLDAEKVFIAILDELPIRQVRLPVHWNDVQPEPHVQNFEELDWMMAEASKRNVQVVLAIGNKVPRWPECHTPVWAQNLSEEEYQVALLDYIDVIVTRYRTYPALERWQVENEVLFPFGDCPKPNYDLVKREIAHVRALDDIHPIQLTVSGEQQLWASLARDADVIGASMYRRVVLPNGWTVTFPIPARLYTLQALSVALLIDKVVISELQVEPWLDEEYQTYSIDEAAALFTPQELEGNLQYARSTGLKEVSLWGVEWWYYLKQNGRPELWNAGRENLK